MAAEDALRQRRPFVGHRLHRACDRYQEENKVVCCKNRSKEDGIACQPQAECVFPVSNFRNLSKQFLMDN